MVSKWDKVSYLGKLQVINQFDKPITKLLTQKLILTLGIVFDNTCTCFGLPYRDRVQSLVTTQQTNTQGIPATVNSN